MNRLFAAPVLALGLGFAAMPASAVVYCKTVGVPKGCVARPALRGGARSGVGVRPAAVVVPGASATNQNGGVNRVGVRR